MMTVPTSLHPSTIHGVGVFAKQRIPKGTIVWKFHEGFDLYFSEEQIAKLPAATQQEVYNFSYPDPKTGKHLFCSGHGGFMNHSATTNTSSPYDMEQTIATKDIEAGEEITCDYTTFYGSYLGKDPKTLFQDKI